MSDYNDFSRNYKRPPKNNRNFDYYCGISFAELLDEFEQWMRLQGFSNETIKGKKKKVRKFFRDTKLALREITTDDREKTAAYQYSN